jgi:hypothetical protein
VLNLYRKKANEGDQYSAAANITSSPSRDGKRRNGQNNETKQRKKKS